MNDTAQYEVCNIIQQLQLIIRAIEKYKTKPFCFRFFGIAHKYYFTFRLYKEKHELLTFLHFLPEYESSSMLLDIGEILLKIKEPEKAKEYFESVSKTHLCDEQDVQIRKSVGILESDIAISLNRSALSRAPLIHASQLGKSYSLIMKDISRVGLETQGDLKCRLFKMRHDIALLSAMPESK